MVIKVSGHRLGSALSESGLVVSRFGVNVSDSDPLDEMVRPGASYCCVHTEFR